MLDEVHVQRLEQKLNATLPRHPIFDDTDRRTARRTASHVAAETAFVREYTTFPREGVAIAVSSDGRARLLLLPRETAGKELGEATFYWDPDLEVATPVAHDIVELTRVSKP